MKLAHHISFSAVISTILYFILESWRLSLVSFISGILIDIDHILDYLIEYRMRFDMQEFLNFFYKEKHRKITLILHGWEWLLCLGLATVLIDYNPWIAGLFVGYGHHMVSDFLYSKANLKSYSLIWRWTQKFNSEIIFPRDRGYNP